MRIHDALLTAEHAVRRSVRCAIVSGALLWFGTSACAGARPLAAAATAAPKVGVAPKAAAVAAIRPVHAFTLNPEQSRLQFSFVQAGAKTTGAFRDFSATLTCADGNNQCALSVTVAAISIDTKDPDRDTLLRGPLLFDVKRFPSARFVSSRVGPQAVAGTLTLRDRARSLRIPVTLRFASEAGRSVAYIAGQFALNRLDFGIGQGEWASTEWVANGVTISFEFRLTGGA